MGDVDEILKGLIGHKVSILFTHRDEARLRDISGILRGLKKKDMIHITVYDEYGEESEHYLNGRACTLVSISDDGKPKGTRRHQPK